MATLDYNTDYPDPSDVPMMPTALRYGLIGGLVMIVYGIVMNLIGMGAGTGNDMLNGILSLVVFAGVIYFALQKHRDEDLGGYMSYGRGLGLGTLTCLFMGILGGIFTYVYMAFIDPSIIDQILERTREQYENMGMDEEQIEMSLSMVESMTNPIMMTFWSVVGYVIMGFIASLIISAIVKKNPPEFA